MKNKKSVWITIFLVITIILVGWITFNSLNDPYRLTPSEKKWINNHINTVQNINVINDVNIFGKSSGVFYDFIKDLETEYKLEVNPVTFNYGENKSGITLGAKTILNENDQIFYTDHYVLVGKTEEIILKKEELSNKKIGVINSELSYITSYLREVNPLSFIGYETKEALLEAYEKNEEIQNIIVPEIMYLDEILKNNDFINSHLSDIKLYYTISGDPNETFTSIVNKFYHNWQEENLEAYMNREKLNIFTTALNISKTELDAMQSITYNYGFMNNSPYEVIMSGNYGGIIAMYLDSFAKFSDIEFKYTKYNNLNSFKEDIVKNKIDLYFNYYNNLDNLNSINSNILLNYSILANKENSIVIHSIYSLVGKTVYVQENSALHTYLKNINNIKVETYEDENDLKKLNNKDVLIFVDKNIYELYKNSKLSNYTERYTSKVNQNYYFKCKNNSAFNRLFTKYLMSLDSEEMIYKGVYNHSLTVKTGNILITIAKYILLTIVGFALIFIIFYKSSKKIKIAKKIKKEDKMKFIDQLTSLKNRNYLNEYIHNWNNNTIYPQTMIVIDLNNIQFINDTLGYEEGDKQIKAAANILIKTQLDNSDMMRTDGNEFLIYLVGYTQKAITNYIHKLNKEFKKLPYEYGAEFGYSMINDNIKTIEDAILEATADMKKQKKKSEEEE